MESLVVPFLAAIAAASLASRGQGEPGLRPPPIWPTDAAPSSGRDPAAVPAYATLDPGLPPMRGIIERYGRDLASLARSDEIPMSGWAVGRRRAFLARWQEALAAVDFAALDQDGRIDWILLRNQLEHERRQLDHEAERRREIAPLLPFAGDVVRLLEDRRRLEPVEPRAVARLLASLAERIDAQRELVAEGLEGEGAPRGLAATKRTVCNRAASTVGALRRALRDWHRFYDGYDPLFTWWVEKPHAAADAALERYAAFIREKLVGVGKGEDEPIIGDPIGRQALLDLLAYEMIPYTPEQLVDIARREHDWCRRELIRASRELGFGDDWRQALEHVKTLHVEPGRQPQLIRELADEAVEFLEQRDLLTIPPLCKETWRMEMMSPERQKVSPYFLGGEVIIVSFPTHEMEHADKLMSMRGNNVHFARATVHHELIPGHHLQGFMTQRYRTHRRVFRTPFWLEGWALYWEMLLWDLEFPRSAEDRVGMLFWRSHRCARIVFSLSFHLEQMTPEQCIDYLVENVGHERNNATAEVRRSVSGAYGPLYQAAYMLGGLQIRSLREELVEPGHMTDRDFHDSILRQNSMPIELVRAALTGAPLAPDHEPSWAFYGDVGAP